MMSAMTAEAWQHVAEVVRSRREQQRWSQAKLATLAGTSESTIRRLEKGNGATTPANLRAVITALGFTTASADLVLDGKEPVIAGEDPPESSREEILRRLDKIEALLAEIRADRRRDSARARTGD